MSRSEHVLLALVFAVYCAATIAGATTHEPWWDEAQAWLIARDAPLGHLLLHVVRYEGHPPLWYLILALPAKLGLPYWWLKVAGALGGAAGALLLLWGFPRAPIYVRLLAPFAFYIAYQYTIVARSYVLLLPLLLLVARMYDRRHLHPGRFALLLILISNVSVHGFAIACGLAALFLFDAVLKRIPSPPRRAILAAAVAFVLNGIVLVILLWPRADIQSHAHLYSPTELQRHVTVLMSIVPPLFWPPVGEETTTQAVAIAAAAVVALGVLVTWFVRNGAGAPFAVATVGAYCVALRYYSMWHEGIFFFLLLFGAMLAFHRRPETKLLALDVAAQLVLVLMLLQHAQWAFQSLGYDLRWDATGSKRAADYIREQALDQRQLYGTGLAVVEIQPYFASNVLDNYENDGRAYWEWSRRNRWPYPQFTVTGRREMDRWFGRLMLDKPEYIVHGSVSREDDIYAALLFRDGDYRRMASFGGYTYWKNSPNRLISFHLFRRADMPPPSAPHAVAR